MSTRGLIVTAIVAVVGICFWLLIAWAIQQRTSDTQRVETVPHHDTFATTTTLDHGPHLAAVELDRVASYWTDLATAKFLRDYEESERRKAAARKEATRTAVRPATVRGDLVDALARCESNMNPRAYNPAGPYYSYFQWALSTWRKAGGTGHPYDAPYGTQKALAIAWAKRTSWGSQWPVCSRKVGLA